MKDCEAEHKVYNDEDDGDSVFQIKSAPAQIFKDKVKEVWRFLVILWFICIFKSKLIRIMQYYATFQL